MIKLFINLQELLIKKIKLKKKVSKQGIRHDSFYCKNNHSFFLSFLFSSSSCLRIITVGVTALSMCDFLTSYINPITAKYDVKAR